MVVATETQERTSRLLHDALPMLCRSGLADESNILSIDAIIGITLENKDVLLVTIKSNVGGAEVKKPEEVQRKPSTGSSKNVSSTGQKRPDREVLNKDNKRRKSSEYPSMSKPCSLAKEARASNGMNPSSALSSRESSTISRQQSSPFVGNTVPIQPVKQELKSPDHTHGALFGHAGPVLSMAYLNTTIGSTMSPVSINQQPRPPQQSKMQFCPVLGCNAKFVQDFEIFQHLQQCHGSGQQMRNPVRLPNPGMPNTSTHGFFPQSHGQGGYGATSAPYIVSIEPRQTPHPPPPPPLFQSGPAAVVYPGQSHVLPTSLPTNVKKPPSSSKPVVPKAATSTKKRQQSLRATFSSVQYNELIKEFNINPYPTFEQKKQFATKFGLTQERISSWFNSRRSELKKKGQPLRLIKLEPNFHPDSKKTASLSREQISALRKEYSCTGFPTQERKVELSSKLHMDIEQISFWFRKRRLQDKNARVKLVPVSNTPVFKINTDTNFSAPQSEGNITLDTTLTSSALACNTPLASPNTKSLLSNKSSVNVTLPEKTEQKFINRQESTNGSASVSFSPRNIYEMNHLSNTPYRHDNETAAEVENGPIDNNLPDLSQFDVALTLPDLPGKKHESGNEEDEEDNDCYIDLTSPERKQDEFPL